MKIAFTWDYELFFGLKTGSVEKCMLQPTAELLRIARENNAKFTFFPDVAWLLKDQNDAVIHQIKQWHQEGHETGLHIHPHWEDCEKIGSEWNMNLNRYKLADFSKEDAAKLIKKYSNEVERITGQRAGSFRAGGWCVQPFFQIKDALHEAGIYIDSSVFQGGKNLTLPYHYDFSTCPKDNSWRFEDEVCRPTENGIFVELPIASKMYSPWFFWKLFILGRMRPSHHKPIGDGYPAAGGGSKKQLLTRQNLLCVSSDGYFATQIQRAINKAEKLGQEKMVVIGHPKACTLFSLRQLEKFIRQSTDHEFVNLRELANK